MPFLNLSNVALVYPALGFRPDAQRIDGLKRDQGLGSRFLTGRKGGIEALHGISFSLHSGDRLGIMGHNGSGKSTLLRVMAGILEPTEGRVEAEGEISALFNVGIGMKIEATGVQNIILSGLIRGLTRAEAEARIPEIAEFSGLGEYLLMPVRTYSRGMVMRLTFSTATAFEPEILLLDEWIGAGDREFRKKAQARMETMVDGAGIVAVATHRLPLIRSLCTHFLWLQSGLIVEFGDDPEIVTRFEEAQDKKSRVNKSDND